MRVHCLFEQSGTFKNEFKKLGIDAIDYDILDDFGQTDHVVDLFKEIEGGYLNQPSIFDEIGPDDLIIAFFPCTRFEAIIPLKFRGEAIDQKNWELDKKLKYSMRLHDELHELYTMLCMMVCICIDRGLKLIIENPYTQPHYLTSYWCIRPDIIDKDRRVNGDYYRKPTQYWFINCEPKHNFIFEPIEYVETKIIDQQRTQVDRSLIHPQYANRFIREFILDSSEETTCTTAANT